MSRFTDTPATIITGPSTDFSEKTVDDETIHSITAKVSYMGAVTKPIQGGLSASIDATILKGNDQEITYIHPHLGWCVNFIPLSGVLTQMTQLQDLRESHPVDASELCKKCEHLIQVASIGELEDFRLICGDVLAIPTWGKPPPLWYVSRMFVAAVCRGNLPIVQWLIEGGISPRSLPPVSDVIHDVVNRFVVGSDGGVTSLQVITFLVIDGNFDVSRPRKGDGWTPLHLAAQRNLLIVAKHLIQLGADVNAIGRDDMMPLILADRISKMLRPAIRSNLDHDDGTDEHQDTEHDRGEIIEKEGDKNELQEDEKLKENASFVVEEFITPLQKLLLEKGARRTWRRDPIPIEPPNKLKSVRFKGGFSQQDVDEGSTSSSVVQRADGGFTISCD